MIDNGLMDWTNLDAAAAERLAAQFRTMNKRLMVPMWRLGLGRAMNAWPSVGGRILVLVHYGRKSHRRYATPLNYHRQGDEVFVTAGFGSRSDWLLNAVAAGDVELWLPGERRRARPIDMSDDPNQIDLLRKVLVGSGIVAPLAGIDPKRLDDDELGRLTKEYRLVRFDLAESITGPNGPGDWSWVWPATASAALLIWAARASRSSHPI